MGVRAADGVDAEVRGSFWTVGGFVSWWESRRSVELGSAEVVDGRLEITLTAAREIHDLGIEAGGAWDPRGSPGQDATVKTIALRPGSNAISLVAEAVA